MKQLCLLTLGFMLFIQAGFSQVITTVGGTSSTGSSSIVCVAGTFNAPSAVNTATSTDWADFTLVIGLGCSYYIQSTLNGNGVAGTYAGFHVRGANLLSLLTGMSIDTYNNGVYVQSSGAGNLLSLLNGGEGDVYFKTTLPYNELRLNLAGLLSVAYDMDIFYGFGSTAQPNGILLPLDFNGFSAARAGDQVNVKWQFNTDEEVTATTLEKSSDGQNFKALASLKNTQSSYSFADASSQTAYYRLAVTTNAKKYVSKIAKVDGFNQGLTLSVTNPAKSRINVQVSNSRQGNYVVQLLNSDGKVVYQRNQSLFNVSSFTVDRSNLRNGMYVLRVSGNGQDNFVQKIVLE